ncbi:sulfatase family protein [Pedosphaera parvula]|uniref:Sulfatase n=1 Tax=Pedosphaera parvula (strain Ellin514) TaxID=320771 RepID=B9XS23_PEDPL|nr:sulfatase [Pedosphaera parvula]EEF57355.1 sulfatase [Pedosphaera parvula Ellin514]
MRTCLWFFVVLFSMGMAHAATSQKPNIIFILADDMGYGDIGPFGSTLNRTPNLDRMAKEGMKLTSFYAAPLCTPSRAQILTGCYAKRVSLPKVLSPRSEVGLNTNEQTVAKLLKRQGYATMAIGKWHVGDAPENLPTRHGFDHYLGLPYSNDMGGEEPGKDQPAKRGARPPLPLVRDEQVIEVVKPADQDRLTERYTDEAVKFIRANDKQPFFLYLAHTAVHAPIHPGHNFRGKSRNGLYGDWVEEVDWSVGKVLDTLRELGLSENTLVLFSSDNGPWLAQKTNGGTAGPLRGGKGGTFEGGMREPTLAWWPGKVPAQSVCDTVAGNIDLLPTFVKLAGGTLPKDKKIDGRDISNLLLGQTKEAQREAHYYFAGTALQAVRSGPWKLAIVPQYEGMGKFSENAVEGGKPFAPRLYNLDEDIGEKTDVVAEHPDEMKRLLGYVEAMEADLGVSKKNGPGVRPPGRVAKPLGLWLPGEAPEESAKPRTLSELKVGDAIGKDEAPRIAKKSFRVSCEVESKSKGGVIVAQGGSAVGYAIYLMDGKPAFAVRADGVLNSISASNAPEGKFHVEGKLAPDGKMILAVNGKTVAAGKAAGLIPKQPAENFCVGFDDGHPVADYGTNSKFEGSISGIKVEIE